MSLGGLLEGNLSLEFVSTDTTVRAGDVVITSGLGGVFPKGLIVGEVTRVSKTPASLYQEIQLSPSGRLGNLEEVLVIVGTPSPTLLGAGE